MEKNGTVSRKAASLALATLLAAAAAFCVALLPAAGVGAGRAYADEGIWPSSMKIVEGVSVSLELWDEGGDEPAKAKGLKSSNKKVATVSSSGKVTAKKKGTCTITGKLRGKTIKCKVKVVKPLGKVTGLTVKVVGKGKVKLSWNKVAGTDRYIFHWREAGTGKYGWHASHLSTKTSCTYSDGMFKKGKSYEFRVCASNDDIIGEGPWSKAVKVKMTK